MKMKKGQAQQIFVWIFILILAVTTLFFGIKTFRQGENLKDEVLLVDFSKNLERQINNFYYLDIGSSGKEDFILPSNVREVCFLNQTITENPPGNPINPIDGPNPTYINQLKEFSNVFIFPETSFKQNRFKLSNFIVSSDSPYENPLCIPVIGGRVNIKFENVGNFVEIKNG